MTNQELFLSLIKKVQLHSNDLVCNSCKSQQSKFNAFVSDFTCDCGGKLISNDQEFISQLLLKEYESLELGLQENINKILKIKTSTFIDPRELGNYESLLVETLPHINGTDLMSSIKWI